jgi:hypothetical protein
MPGAEKLRERLSRINLMFSIVVPSREIMLVVVEKMTSQRCKNGSGADSSEASGNRSPMQTGGIPFIAGDGGEL